MNALERLLQDDVNRLVDRLAALTREGTLAECAERRTDVFERLERAEARLTTARQDLIDGYAAWCRALDECADAWALADLTADLPAAESLRAA